MLPLDLIGRTWARQSVPNGIDTVEVKHVTGGVSSLGFKSYDQDIKAFYGTARHVIDWTRSALSLSTTSA